MAGTAGMLVGVACAPSTLTARCSRDAAPPAFLGVMLLAAAFTAFSARASDAEREGDAIQRVAAHRARHVGGTALTLYGPLWAANGWQQPRRGTRGASASSPC